MKLELVSLTGPKFEEAAYEVTLPTADGAITVLPGHMPLVTVATPGVVSVRRQRGDSDDKVEHFATHGGIVEISADHVRVLVDEADREDEIVEAETREALERAHAAKVEAKDMVELAQAQAVIDRQAVRLKVAGLRRHRRGGPRM